MGYIHNTGQGSLKVTDFKNAYYFIQPVQGCGCYDESGKA